MYKFGVIKDGEEVSFSYPNIWAVERTAGPDRLVIAPDGGHLDLMFELAACWSPGYGVLYVLLFPRVGNESGRYQCPEPLFSVELKGFIATYRTFLETDGRHHLWIGSLNNEGTLVYDHHNVVYAYGPIEAYRRVLEARGLKQVPEVRFPSPHVHRYHVENDEWEASIMTRWAWRKTPLQENDDR